MTEWEWMVSSRIPVTKTTWRTRSTPPTDEMTARAIAGWRGDGIERTLYRRRKAGPWQEAEQ